MEAANPGFLALGGKRAGLHVWMIRGERRRCASSKLVEVLGQVAQVLEGGNVPNRRLDLMRQPIMGADDVAHSLLVPNALFMALTLALATWVNVGSG